jgi:hypothetical protein
LQRVLFTRHDLLVFLGRFFKRVGLFFKRMGRFFKGTGRYLHPARSARRLTTFQQIHS